MKSRSITESTSESQSRSYLETYRARSPFYAVIAIFVEVVPNGGRYGQGSCVDPGPLHQRSIVSFSRRYTPHSIGKQQKQSKRWRNANTLLQFALPARVKVQANIGAGLGSGCALSVHVVRETVVARCMGQRRIVEQRTGTRKKPTERNQLHVTRQTINPRPDLSTSLKKLTTDLQNPSASCVRHMNSENTVRNGSSSAWWRHEPDQIQKKTITVSDGFGWPREIKTMNA